MIHGFINLNKPVGWTSHDCVARTRKLLGTKKIGHGGTLDPLATGVLPLAVGRATRLLQYLPEGKAYRAVIRFGVITTTDDLEGNIAKQQDATELEEAAVDAALSQFIGKIEQVPPMYSAIQVEGRRLYDLARAGKAVEVPKRVVTIEHLVSQSWKPGVQPELTVDIKCGAGTYIRSLARDLGEAVGTGATLAGLTRTYSSGFKLTDSLTLENLEKAIAQNTFAPVSAGKAMEHLAAITLPPDLARRWQLGQKLEITAGIPIPQPIGDHANYPPVRILEATTQTFLGIGEIRSLPFDPLPSDPLSVECATKILVPKRVFLTAD
ncbi:tRNA pseudouridine synthase B, putative [Synechococcus sp. PCC 7335]|uniref:tRNA pseudouridine(55) synthase TruB n=1 Tax=Synechococcus sp. (strain ATCC 29403 / PCC 7335) TaxID=91464 RepID=UPI00017ED95E|nr:tRNA pseudouridine(55) synthase TruB [Synechococcus sp. PCC 7335]EDX85956.1 tRNA pseudouridine synthase B, putative [Synechococcus sp. PCC 7335]